MSQPLPLNSVVSLSRLSSFRMIL